MVEGTHSFVRVEKFAMNKDPKIIERTSLRPSIPQSSKRNGDASFITGEEI